MNNSEYHADRTAISKSGLDLINKSPAHYKYWLDHARDETAAMQKGTLVHTLALEPETVRDAYAVMPADIKQRRGKAYDEFAADAGSRIILTLSQMDEAKRIVDAVERNPVARKIIAEAQGIEESVFAEDFGTGIKCKCRPDIRYGNTLYDLKTTRNANGRSFGYSVRSYRYHVQAAFYLDVCQWAGVDVNQFGFIAVDSDAMPYQCTVFHRLEDKALEMGREEYRQNLDTFAECIKSGEWPGYPQEYDELSMAGYAYDLDELQAAA